MQLFQKKAVPQRNFSHLSVAAKRQRAANTTLKIHPTKAREQCAGLIEKTEIAILNADSSNFRSHCQTRFLSRRFTVNGDLRFSGRISRCGSNHGSRVCLDKFALYLRLGDTCSLLRRTDRQLYFL